MAGTGICLAGRVHSAQLRAARLREELLCNLRHHAARAARSPHCLPQSQQRRVQLGSTTTPASPCERGAAAPMSAAIMHLEHPALTAVATCLKALVSWRMPICSGVLKILGGRCTRARHPSFSPLPALAAFPGRAFPGQAMRALPRSSRCWQVPCRHWRARTHRSPRCGCALCSGGAPPRAARRRRRHPQPAPPWARAAGRAVSRE